MVGTAVVPFAAAPGDSWTGAFVPIFSKQFSGFPVVFSYPQRVFVPPQYR
jgi:hypothetical protein